MKKIGKYFLRECLFFGFLIPRISDCQQYNIPVSFDLNSFRIENTDSFSSIQYLGNAGTWYFLQPGYPELPYIPINVLLPHNSKINKIIARDINSQPFKDSVFAQVDNKYVQTVPAPDYPASEIITDSTELYAGFLISKIYICPFKYLTETRRLILHTNLVLDIYLQTIEKPLIFESSPEKIKLSRDFIRNLVINREDIDRTIPLKEKIDYSKIHLFNEIGEDSIRSLAPSLKKTDHVVPFHLKHIKTCR